MRRSKMMKTADGLVMKVTLDDEQMDEIRAYIDECFKSLQIQIHVEDAKEPMKEEYFKQLEI